MIAIINIYHGYIRGSACLKEWCGACEFLRVLNLESDFVKLWWLVINFNIVSAINVVDRYIVNYRKLFIWPTKKFKINYHFLSKMNQKNTVLCQRFESQKIIRNQRRNFWNFLDSKPSFENFTKFFYYLIIRPRQASLFLNAKNVDKIFLN